MCPFVVHLAQPARHLGVGGDDVQLQTILTKRACQRHLKRAAQVAVEAFDLALVLGLVWLAQLDDEAAVLGKVEEASERYRPSGYTSRSITTAFMSSSRVLRGTPFRSAVT